MSLIERLTAEHNALRDALQKINELRVSQPEGRDLIFKTKSLLLAHLALEDKELYPALNRLAESKVLASSFHQEMQDISVSVLSFFKKYDGGITDGIEFARDFGQIRAIREETRLYPAFKDAADLKVQT